MNAACTSWFSLNFRANSNSMELSNIFRDIRVVQSRSRPPKPPKPPKRSKQTEGARRERTNLDELDRLNAPLRPGPPYDDQVSFSSYSFLTYLFIMQL